MSDIFAALVEKWKSQSDDPTNNHINDAVWKIGEDVYTPATAGDALRYMYDSQRNGNYDYYLTRYVGTADNGGVHVNSGIANLGGLDRQLFLCWFDSRAKYHAQCDAYLFDGSFAIPPSITCQLLI